MSSLALRLRANQTRTFPSLPNHNEEPPLTGTPPVDPPPEVIETQAETTSWLIRAFDDQPLDIVVEAVNTLTYRLKACGAYAALVDWGFCLGGTVKSALEGIKGEITFADWTIIGTGATVEALELFGISSQNGARVRLDKYGGAFSAIPGFTLTNFGFGFGLTTNHPISGRDMGAYQSSSILAQLRGSSGFKASASMGRPGQLFGPTNTNAAGFTYAVKKATDANLYNGTFHKSGVNYPGAGIPNGLPNTPLCLLCGGHVGNTTSNNRFGFWFIGVPSDEQLIAIDAALQECAVTLEILEDYDPATPDFGDNAFTVTSINAVTPPDLRIMRFSDPPTSDSPEASAFSSYPYTEGHLRYKPALENSTWTQPTAVGEVFPDSTSLGSVVTRIKNRINGNAGEVAIAQAQGAVLTLTGKQNNVSFDVSATAVNRAVMNDQAAVVETVREATFGLSQITTVTLSGTMEVGDRFTVTIDGRRYGYGSMAQFVWVNCGDNETINEGAPPDHAGRRFADNNGSANPITAENPSGGKITINDVECTTYYTTKRKGRFATLATVAWHTGHELRDDPDDPNGWGIYDYMEAGGFSATAFQTQDYWAANKATIFTEVIESRLMAPNIVMPGYYKMADLEKYAQKEILFDHEPVDYISNEEHIEFWTRAGEICAAKGFELCWTGHPLDAAPGRGGWNPTTCPVIMQDPNITWYSINLRRNDTTRGYSITDSANKQVGFATGGLTATKVLDVPSLANGASATTDINMPGLVMGQEVYAPTFGPGSLLQNPIGATGCVQLSAEAVATDTYRVTFTNNTGVTQNIGVGTLYAYAAGNQPINWSKVMVDVILGIGANEISESDIREVRAWMLLKNIKRLLISPSGARRGGDINQKSQRYTAILCGLPVP